jgi:hypothetical protein
VPADANLGGLFSFFKKKKKYYHEVPLVVVRIVVLHSM